MFFQKDGDGRNTGNNRDADDDREGMRIIAHGQDQVHPIDCGNHGRNADDDRDGCEPLDRLGDIIGENDLIRIA